MEYTVKDIVAATGYTAAGVRAALRNVSYAIHSEISSRLRWYSWESLPEKFQKALRGA